LSLAHRPVLSPLNWRRLLVRESIVRFFVVRTDTRAPGPALTPLANLCHTLFHPSSSRAVLHQQLPSSKDCGFVPGWSPSLHAFFVVILATFSHPKLVFPSSPQHLGFTQCAFNAAFSLVALPRSACAFLLNPPFLLRLSLTRRLPTQRKIDVRFFFLARPTYRSLFPPEFFYLWFVPFSPS